jgi:tRNA-specific 2-thiouridylase
VVVAFEPHAFDAEPRTVVVAMSGGVDSSVAAAMLARRGHRVIGVTIKTYCFGEVPAGTRTCCGLDGIADARMVADKLDIPHYVFDMEKGFTESVIDDFVAEYAAGRTPNPCVRCNADTKIPDLFERARRFGAEAVATGHYARNAEGPDGSPRILRGVDRRKDQSYFLWAVPPRAAASLRFPVGDMEKPEVRSVARDLGLVTADKPESQDICFVPDGDYGGFLARRLGEDHPALRHGALRTVDGTRVGTHNGYARYTVGQRRGLGGGRGRPLHVLRVDPGRGEVVVGPREALFRDTVTLGDLNWLEQQPGKGERLLAQLRHGAEPAEAGVESISSGSITLRFEEPRWAVTPGQSGALYRGDVLIGGGRIR